jgi:hypothetical protein
MPTPNDCIPLPQATPAVRDYAQQHGATAETLARLNYRAMYGAVTDGLIPARRQGRMWMVLRADLPQIAAALGLLPNAKQPRSHRAAPFNLAVIEA